MKLLICAGIFPPDIGGPATYTELLAQRMHEGGHEVCVITYSDTDRSENDSGYSFPVNRVKRSGFKPWHYLKYFQAVKKYGEGVDIIYAQDPVTAGWPALLAANKLGKPLAVKIVGDYSWEQAMNRGLTKLMIDDFQKEKNFSGLIKKMRDIQKRVVSAASLIITPSNYLKQIVLGWGAVEGNIQVIHNAVRLPESEFTKQEAREKVAFPKDDFIVVTLGRNVPWKGFTVLKKVGEEFVREGKKIKIKVLSNISHKEVLLNLRAADAFVLNSGYEGFPHSVVEAMGMDLPVMVSDVGGNKEIVEDEQNGLLFQYNNTLGIRAAILRLKHDQDLRKRLITAGRDIVKKFSVEEMVEKTERALTQLMNKQ